MIAITPEELAALRHYLIRNEGRRYAAYSDSRGILTVGVGFNLFRADARQKIRGLGLDYDKVLKGEQVLNDEQIEVLLAEDLHTAVTAAAALVPGWASLSAARKRALADMAFNLGATGLAKFSRLIVAIGAKNWEAAEAEIMNSIYSRQVGPRARRNARAIRHGNA